MKVKKIGDTTRYKSTVIGAFSLKEVAFIVAGLIVGVIVFKTVNKIAATNTSVICGLIAGGFIAASGCLTIANMPMYKALLKTIGLVLGKGERKYIMEGSELFEETDRKRKKRKADKEQA